jgi:hypothetical protein
MALQALLVNNDVAKEPFHRWTPTYENLNEFADPIPPGFSESESNPPGNGVHLHWKLPSALTRARGKSTEKATFLFTPNRWMVVRLLASAADSTVPPKLSAWIVESDFMDPNSGTSPFANPHTSESGKVETTRLGRSVAIEQWDGEAGGEMFLQPTGLADVTFTVFQPGIENVFSFHDANTFPDQTLLTYLVAGWYSDPQHDPLMTPDPLAPTQNPPVKLTPDALNWNLLGNAAQAPSLCVLHGLIYGLSWQNKGVPVRIDADATKMQVAVGSTAVDALAAIIATNAGNSGGELETKLQAFQYDTLHTLDDPDGMAQLELKIRDAWFGSSPGGTRWNIIAAAQGAHGSDQEQPLERTPVPSVPPLTTDQEKWLVDLNVTQRELDNSRRELMTMQWELFALWWKSQRGPHVSEDQSDTYDLDLSVILKRIGDELDSSNDQSAISAVRKLQDHVAELAAQLPDPTSPDSIALWSQHIPPGTESPPDPVALALKPSALPSFFHPTDPVLLVAGHTPPTNDVDDRVPLPCRTLDAVVTGVQAGANPVTQATGSLESAIPIPATAKLPAPVAAAVTALAVETFFVDPNNAAVIMNAGLASSDFAALKTAMAAGSAQISTIKTDVVGDPEHFDPDAPFAFVAWQQAWAPVFLQWDIEWLPTVEVNPSGPSAPAGGGDGQAQDNWAFTPGPWHYDGSDDVTARGSEYYGWTGGEPWGAGLEQVTSRHYQGRTFLTPHSTFLLMRRLVDYVRLHPDDADLAQIQTLIDAIGETRFLSQALSGFNSAFIMRGLTHAPGPADPVIANAIAGENRGVPMVEVGDQASLADGTGTPFFFPVRGGFFQFNRLVIVDSFGQKLDLLEANGNHVKDAPNFFPIRGAGLVPDADSQIDTPARRIKQAPRIVQPSRLDLRLLDANDDTKEVFYASGANPVCGWVLPNHLDQSIAAYDAAGNPLGEMLVLADASGNQMVKWLPAPDVVNPITDPSQISNPHLSAALAALNNTKDGRSDEERVAAFRALYQSIDETLWMIDPPGGQGDHDLAVLIGRPLAMVRAQLQFELFGKPAVNQSWRETLLNADAGLTTFSFPIRLGSTELLDDGLIGYFGTPSNDPSIGDTYAIFNAVHPSTGATSPYVKAVAPGNYLQLPFDYPAYTKENLTLLLDPLAKVHATTGILPTAKLKLPAQFYATALARIAVTFRTGPVLTQPDTIRLPFPAEQHGTWAWIRRTGTGATDWEIDPILPANAQARLEDNPPHLIDGWLQFSPTADKSNQNSNG